jgi:site-specific DNA recombinase
VPPYGSLLAPACPRDPQRLRLAPVKAAVVIHIFAWDTDPPTPHTLYGGAKRRSDVPGPTPMGTPRWNTSSVRGLLCNPVSTGIAHRGKRRPVPARTRQAALRPVGPGLRHRPTPPEDWLPLPVPALSSQETCEAAQARLVQNSHRACRNTTAHQSLLRGLVSCGQCA